MDIPAPVIFVIVLFVAVGLIFLAGRFLPSPAVRRRTAPRLEPSNHLEELMVAAMERRESELNAEIREALRLGPLLGLEAAGFPGIPMTFSETFPAEFAREGDQLGEDGKLHFDPYVICFSSQVVVQGLAADSIMGPMATELGRVREFTIEDIAARALDDQVNVVLNPYFGISRRITQDELRDILDGR